MIGYFFTDLDDAAHQLQHHDQRGENGHAHQDLGLFHGFGFVHIQLPPAVAPVFRDATQFYVQAATLPIHRVTGFLLPPADYLPQVPVPASAATGLL